MLTIRRILFPTDYSTCAERAFTHAAHLADRHGAELHVLHVTEPDGSLLNTYFNDFTITPADIAADLDVPLDPQADRPEDEPLAFVEREVPGPDPAPAILRYADVHEIDLIVMGTHGRRGLRRMMIGSVAEEVVRLAPCPVFTVRTPEGYASGRGSSAIRRVLAPVDFSDRAYAAARHAAALAQTYDADLVLAFVVDASSLPATTVPYDGTVSIDVRAIQQSAQDMLDGLANDLQEEIPALRGRVTSLVRVGHPVSDILDVAESTGTDLLVLGSHGRTGLKRFFLGSVAEQLIRMAPCPVFTLKSFGVSLLEASGEGTPAVATASH